MLIFIENTPRAYAWGSRDALPGLLGVAPTGEPQAEIWFGDHPGAPATVAKARPTPQTVIDLIESDPELYGVDGKHLPFLMKLLGIGAPLSLQVHPDKRQAEAGFAREEAAGVPVDAPERSYGDPNHKPEVLVALGEVTALCGFRPLADARADLLALIALAPAGEGRDALEAAAEFCAADSDEAGAARASLMRWALGVDEADGRGVAGGGGDRGGAGSAGGAGGRAAAMRGVAAIAQAVASEEAVTRIAPDRLRALRELTAAHPSDPGVLITLLLHLVTLRPGEAVYLAERQLHAYLSGVAVEIMAASDNVLRAGLTVKHVAADELLRVVDTDTLASPRLSSRTLAPGLVVWQPDVPDFRLLRARVAEDDQIAHEGEYDTASGGVASSPAGPRADADAFRVSDTPGTPDAPGCAESVRVDVPYPMVLVVTEGRVRVERVGAELSEVASAARGQSLYVSSGDAIELSGTAEVFLATVGDRWSGVS